MKRISLFAALLTGTAVLSAAPAFAGNTVATQTIGVGLVVDAQCTISAPATLSFGTHVIILGDVNAQADMTIECTKETPYSIALDAGLNSASAGTTTRAMKSGSNYIDYDLYSGSAGGTFWGHTGGTDTVDSGSAQGADETITIYGQVPSHQNQPIGTYAD